MFFVSSNVSHSVVKVRFVTNILDLLCCIPSLFVTSSYTCFSTGSNSFDSDDSVSEDITESNEEKIMPMLGITEV